MHTTFGKILSFVAVGTHIAAAVDPLLFHRAACNADNCYRVVAATSGPATSIPLTVRSSDCSSFLKVIATPATSTISTTVTVTPAVSVVATSTLYVYTSTSTTTVTVTPPAKAKRATTSNGIVYNSGTAVPSYIGTTCGSVGTTALSRYSSACSCLGVRGTTTTLAAPSTTTTITLTAATPLTTVSTTISTGTTTTATVTSASDPSCPTSTAYDGPYIQFAVTCDYKFLPGTSSYGSVITGMATLEDCLAQCDQDNRHFGDECTAVNYYVEAVDGYQPGTCVYLPLDTLPIGGSLSGVPMKGVKAAKRTSYN